MAKMGLVISGMIFGGIVVTQVVSSVAEMVRPRNELQEILGHVPLPSLPVEKSERHYDRFFPHLIREVQKRLTAKYEDTFLRETVLIGQGSSYEGRTNYIYRQGSKTFLTEKQVR